MTTIGLAGGLALALALLLTPPVRAWATRRGWVCHPNPERWSERSVALMGGLAIVGAVLVALGPVYHQLHSAELTLVGISLLMAVVGAADDRVGLSPPTKLLTQVLAAIALIDSGVRFGLPGPQFQLWDPLITLLWLVGVSNAFNLLDNMDGLCAGIAVITSAFLTILFAGSGQFSQAALTAAMGGACLGYLYYNKHPASIFMGDCGSLFIGTYLAAAVLLAERGHGAGRGVFSILAMPSAVMLIPLMDVALVTISRKWARRPVSQGGRDHSSHRLVAIGLSEPRAVYLLYGLAALGGAVALGTHWLSWYLSTLCLPVVLFVAGAIAVYLGKVRIYEPGETIGELLEQTPIPLLSQHRHRRRMAEVLIDTVAVAFGCYAAWVLRYEDALLEPVHLTAFRNALPAVIAAQLIANFAVGVYRGIWRYTSVGDLRRFGAAAVLGTAGSVILLALAGRLHGIRSTVLALNILTQFTLLSGTRLSIKLMRDSLLAWRFPQGKRTLLVGIGEEAELALRRIEQDAAWGLDPVGAISEGPQSLGLRVRGVPVVGSSHDLPRLVSELRVAEVVLVHPHYPAEAWRRIQSTCFRLDVPVRAVKCELSK